MDVQHSASRRHGKLPSPSPSPSPPHARFRAPIIKGGGRWSLTPSPSPSPPRRKQARVRRGTMTTTRALRNFSPSPPPRKKARGRGSNATMRSFSPSLSPAPRQQQQGRRAMPSPSPSVSPPPRQQQESGRHIGMPSPSPSASPDFSGGQRIARALFRSPPALQSPYESGSPSSSGGGTRGRVQHEGGGRSTSRSPSMSPERVKGVRILKGSHKRLAGDASEGERLRRPKAATSLKTRTDIAAAELRARGRSPSPWAGQRGMWGGHRLADSEWDRFFYSPVMDWMGGGGGCELSASLTIHYGSHLPLTYLSPTSHRPLTYLSPTSSLPPHRLLLPSFGLAGLLPSESEMKELIREALARKGIAGMPEEAGIAEETYRRLSKAVTELAREDKSPQKFKERSTFYVYQLRSLAWMMVCEQTPGDTAVHGGLLCDGMGMGKTTKKIGLCAGDPEGVGQTLVIAPSATLSRWACVLFSWCRWCRWSHTHTQLGTHTLAHTRRDVAHTHERTRR